MFKLFKKKEEKTFTDKELFSSLENDGIQLTDEQLMKARNGDGETLCDIGIKYDDIKDYSKALAWYRNAAAQNSGEAQSRIGAMYYYGQCVPQDDKQAMEWWMKAVNTDGHSRGQYSIGLLYQLGQGVPKDYKQAMNWYLKAVKKDGNNKAQCGIGYLYDRGYGVPKNIHTAIEWYTKAANQGNPLAQYNLGLIYEDANEIKDLQKSVNWYKKASDNGHKEAKTELKRLNKKGYYPQEGVKGIKPSFRSIEEEREKEEQVRHRMETKVSKNKKEKAPKEHKPLFTPLEMKTGYSMTGQFGIVFAPKTNNKKDDDIQLTKEEIQRAKSGDGETLCDIGLKYSSNKNYSKALEWYRNAAAQNNSRAQFYIGVMYFEGRGLRQDYKQAMNWYLKAANNDGHPDAQSNIGYLYEHGLGVSKNIHIAMEWYTKAANQGNGVAQYNLAWNYENEKEIKDLQKAVNWYKKAADNGLDAQSELKSLNKKGYYPQDHVTEITKQSFRSIEEERKKEEQIPQRMETKVFKNKKEKISKEDKQLFSSTKKDGLQLTEEEIQRAKNGDGQMLYEIGGAYYSYEDYSKALTWFLKGASQNNSKSQYMIGYMYREGLGVPQDSQQAMNWYLKAANNDGNSNAKISIGNMYREGSGVQQDYKQAMDWYLKAAKEDGHKDAQCNIGSLYKNGCGVPKDIRAAIEWYTKSANQGQLVAQFNLGVIYETEEEIKDLQKAVNWYNKLAKYEHEKAKNALKRLNDLGYYPQDEEKARLKSIEKEKEKEEQLPQLIETADSNTSKGDVNDRFVTHNKKLLQSPSTKENNKLINQLVEEKMKKLEEEFQLKLGLLQQDEMDKDMLQQKLEQDKMDKEILQQRLTTLEKEAMDRDALQKKLEQDKAKVESEKDVEIKKLKEALKRAKAVSNAGVTE